MISIPLLYHGTIHPYAASIALQGVLLSKSKRFLDFGPGFYTTPNPEFARTTAESHAKTYNYFHPGESVVGRVLEFEFDDRLARSLRTKEFSAADLQWAQFVIANRCENPLVHSAYDHNIDQCYDLVFGPVADGRGTITPMVEQVNAGTLSLADLDYRAIAPASHARWGSQVSFHTKAALGCIRLISVV